MHHPMTQQLLSENKFNHIFLIGSPKSETGGPKDPKLGAKRGSNGIAVMGRMGISLQLADVICACSEDNRET